jgi:hypothetical protein
LAGKARQLAERLRAADRLQVLVENLIGGRRDACARDRFRFVWIIGWRLAVLLGEARE